MDTTATIIPARSPARVPPPVRRKQWRLGGSARKAWLTVHIAAAGAWIGIDIVMGVFVFTALVTDDPQLAGLCYQTLEVFAVWPLAITGLICLGSGIVLGQGSKYGLVRYWWVAVKLVINLVLCALVLMLLRPAVGEVAGYGRDLAAGTAAAGLPDNIFMPPLVSGAALLFATAISVFKPWGRIRRSPAKAVGHTGTEAVVRTGTESIAPTGTEAAGQARPKTGGRVTSDAIGRAGTETVARTGTEAAGRVTSDAVGRGRAGTVGRATTPAAG